MAKDATKALLSNPAYLGSTIAGQKYQANVGLPNEHDVDAELFGNIKKQFGGDGKPRGIDALISGIATGAEYGSKQSGTAKRTGENEKYNKVMDYFMASTMESERLLKDERAKQEKMAKLQPYGMGAMELSYSGQPYDVIDPKIRNLFDQAKLNDPSIKGTYIGHVPNSPLINIRDENGNDSVLSLTKLVGEDVAKMIQGNFIERQKLDAQQQGLQLQERGLGIQQGRLDLERQFAPQKYEAAQSRIEETSRRNDIMEGRLDETGFKRIEAAKQKYIPKIEAAGKVEKVINKIRPIIEKHPEALQSVLNVVWNNDDDGIITGTIKALAQQQTNNETAEAIAELGKYTNELKIGVIKGLSNPNQFVDQIVAGTIPGKNMPPKSFLKILDEMETNAQEERNRSAFLLNEAAPAYGQESANYGDKYSGIIQGEVEKRKVNEQSQNPFSSLSTEDLLARKQQLMGMK